ncbi:MAG TPA: hypothetical protein VNA16_10370, partial [Abditibacteriaceae bacterium]|nr:hypothetical protein [Abditibacteriaceae bacterium]
MNITLREAHRWCAVEYDAKPSKQKLRKALLSGENVNSDFSILSVPAPPRDQTFFKICGNERELLIGIAVFDTVAAHIAYEAPALTDGVEIFFDPRGDELGWVQFVFAPEGGAESAAYLPYPEAHSTAYPLLRLKKHEVTTEVLTSGTRAGWRCRWVFAWFDAAEVFRYGPVCGFNICRSRPSTNEYSAWNFLSGNGGADATGFGHLHRTAPSVQLSDVTATLEDGVLTVEGVTTARPGKLRLELSTPLGARLDCAVAVQGRQWNSTVELPETPPGHYRLMARVDGKLVEPAELAFDIVAPERDFCAGMTYDPPMCVISNFYTPQRLREEMKLISSWGVRRLHWIEYPHDWASFWEHELWAKNYARTVKECGDLLPCAVQQAHHNELEIFADLKVFDLGMNVFFDKRKTASTVQDMDGGFITVLPDIAAHQEWTMQANPAWQTTPKFPIRRLRVYSEEPIPEINARDVRLRVSRDNRTYKNYSGPLEVRQGVLRRPHYRWTPAGKIQEPGTARNWYLELSGLKLNALFAALQIEGEAITLTQRGFMLLEAEDANGNLAPLTMATTGHRDFKEAGYFFWKEWPGWANYTEPLVQRRKWCGNNLGMTFQEQPNMPSLLEPAYAGARDIWLARIQQILNAGADGVSIRTLCHHNGIMTWLKYAFAPAVCETFQSLYGREPQLTPEDYERVRRIRGDFFTQFLRDTKKLTAQAGKKLAFQI